MRVCMRCFCCAFSECDDLNVIHSKYMVFVSRAY